MSYFVFRSKLVLLCMWGTKRKKGTARMQRHALFIYYIVNGKINALREGQLPLYKLAHKQLCKSVSVARPLMLGWCPKEALK